MIDAVDVWFEEFTENSVIPLPLAGEVASHRQMRCGWGNSLRSSHGPWLHPTPTLPRKWERERLRRNDRFCLALAIHPDAGGRKVHPDALGGFGGNAGQRFRDRRRDRIGELHKGRA